MKKLTKFYLAVFFLMSLTADICLAAVQKYGVFEGAFTASSNYTYTNAPALNVQFKGVSGKAKGMSMAVQGFWDGGSRFKVRFSPAETGTWSYSTSSSDSQLNGRSGTFSCSGRLPSKHVSRHGHVVTNPSYPYSFMHADGTPYFLMGDTQWAFSTSDISWPKEFKSYVDARAAQGFNFVHGVVYQSWPSGTAKNEGGVAFNGRNVDQLNPGFWQAFDHRLEYMNQRGISVGFLLAWASDGWEHFKNRGQVERFAEYVVNRYGAYNVMWITEGEYEESNLPGGHDNLGNYIMKNDPYNHPRTTHSVNTSADHFGKKSWLSVVYQQTPSPKEIAKDRVLNKPVINSEFGYEGKQTPVEVRRDAWEIAMEGGYFVYGNRKTYHYNATMTSSNFNSQGAKYVQNIKKCFEDLDWWKLQPKHSLVSGNGTMLCLAERGQQYMVYIRGNGGTNKLSLGKAGSKSYSMKLYDPRKGSYKTLSDVTGTGPVTLDPPNSEDWVFVLTANGTTAGNQSPSASISADKTTVMVGQTVKFKVIASDPDGKIVSHVWDWGNKNETKSGAPSVKASRRWSKSGKYKVSLSVKDNGKPALKGQSNSVTINVVENLPPKIQTVKAKPNSGTAPLTVKLQAVGSDPEKDKLTYEWDFDGDGKFDAKGQNQSFTYKAARHYDPVVRVSDGNQSVTTSLTVDVFKPKPETDTKPPVQSPNTKVKVPSNLQAKVLSSSLIELKWKDNSNNEKRFRIARRVGNGSFRKLATVGANKTNFKDTGLKADTTYTYMVRADGPSAKSKYSNRVRVKTNSATEKTTKPKEDKTKVTKKIDSGSEGVLMSDSLKSSTKGTKRGKGRFVSGGGWQSQGGQIVFDAGRALTHGYFEAKMKGWAAPARGTNKSHPLSGWENPNQYTHYAQQGSFWNWRIGSNYDVFKVLAAPKHGKSRVEKRVGSRSDFNAGGTKKWHTYRVQWQNGKVDFIFDGKVIQSWKFNRFVMRYFTIGKDDLYRLTNSAPVIANVKIVDLSKGAKSTKKNALTSSMNASMDSSSLTTPQLAQEANIINMGLDMPGEPVSWSVYEDAADATTSGWKQYNNGSVSNISYGGDNDERAIEIVGDINNDVFRLGKEDGTDWNNEKEFSAQFSIALDEANSGAVYFQVETTLGMKYLAYADGEMMKSDDPDMIYICLGEMANGQWHTIFRNLEEDLMATYPEAQLLSVKSLFVYGSLKLDNVMLIDFGNGNTN